MFACDPSAAAAVIAAVRRNTAPGVPVLAKLSPDVTDIVAIARGVVDAGADGLSMINTLLGMVIDPDTMRPALAGVTGGLSGPAIRPVAVRCVYQVHAALPDVPILGMGGIRHRPRRAASSSSPAPRPSASAPRPSTTRRRAAACQRELAQALADRGFDRLRDAVGYAHREPDPRPAAGGPVGADDVDGPGDAARVEESIAAGVEG